MALRRPRVRISLGPQKNGSIKPSVREPASGESPARVTEHKGRTRPSHRFPVRSRDEEIQIAAGTPDIAPKAAHNTGQAGWYHGESPFAPDGEDFFI
jgi:hypothetical protein